MAMRISALATPKVLTWARETIGLNLEDAAAKIGIASAKLSEAERGEKSLTFPQLKKAATAYKRPLAIFYLPTPPAETSTVPDFRRVPEAQGAAVSPVLKFEQRRLHRKREIAIRLGQPDKVDWSYVGSIKLDEDPSRVAGNLRKFLNVTVQHRGRDQYAVFKGWRAAIEAKGTLVFLSRRISTTEMRGFSIASAPYPIIAVNRGDKPRARLFTLIHEFTHVLLGVPAMCDLAEDDYLNETERRQVEVYCNAVAAETLVPSAELMSNHVVVGHQRGIEWSDAELEQLSEYFGPSKESVLRRLLTLGLATRAEYNGYRSRSATAHASKENTDISEKGHEIVLRTQGEPYVRIVLNALQREDVTAADVSDYLDMKLDYLDALERSLVGRSEK